MVFNGGLALDANQIVLTEGPGGQVVAGEVGLRCVRENLPSLKYDRDCLIERRTDSGAAVVMVSPEIELGSALARRGEQPSQRVRGLNGAPESMKLRSVMQLKSPSKVSELMIGRCAG